MSLLAGLLEVVDVARRIARLTPSGLKLTPEAARALSELDLAAELLDARASKALDVLTAEADLTALHRALADQRAETLRIADLRWGSKK